MSASHSTVDVVEVVSVLAPETGVDPKCEAIFGGPVGPAFARETPPLNRFAVAVDRYQGGPFLSRSGRTALNTTREAVLNLAEELEWATSEVQRLRDESETLRALLTLALEAA